MIPVTIVKPNPNGIGPVPTVAPRSIRPEVATVAPTGIVATATPQPAPTLNLADLPRDPTKLRQWLVDVAHRQELYQAGRMQPIDDRTTVKVLLEGLKFLLKCEQAREVERRTYLLKRFGTVMLPLDASQPAEGDIIIAERRDGQLEQCIVNGGVAYIWRVGTRGVKFASVTTIVRWRPCDVPVKPVETATPAGEVKAALERGRQLAGDGSGLAVLPGAGQAISETRKL